jgi:cAMP-dependent protein kinase regulator
MGVLESGDFFGEIGLLTNQPRNASVCTLVETRLLAIDRPVVWQLLSKHAEALTLLLRTVRVRLIDQLVRTHPMFAPFGRAKRGALAGQFRLLEVRDGTKVIQQGLEKQGLYVVLAGRLDVIEAGVDGEKSVAVIGHGDLIGEFSELFDQPAQASVISSGKCWLLSLPHQRVAAITAKNPLLLEYLRRLASERYHSRSESLVAASSSGHKA